MPKIDKPITVYKWIDNHGNTLTLEKLPILDVYMVCYYEEDRYRSVFDYYYGSKDATERFEQVQNEWLCESWQDGGDHDQT